MPTHGRPHLPSSVDIEAAAMASMLDRAARDPSVSVDKLEKLYDLQKRVRDDAARRAYDEAFPAMSAELPEIDKRGKILIKEKNGDKVIQSTPYALWEDTNRLIKPILAKHGFGLSFRISQTPERITVTAVLSHSGGHREETAFAAPIDSTGSKNNVQGWGSSLAYCKRYSGTTILNLTTRGEDDDGKTAGAPDPISDEQAATLREWIEATQSDQAAFCAYYKVDTLTALPAAKYDAAVKTFEAKKKKQASK
mgnify:FL=1